MPQVYADDAVTIELLPALGPLANNAYILRPSDGGAVTIVDLPEGAEAIVDAVANDEVERLVVTHSHFDHWAGYNIVRAATDAPVYAGAEETGLDDSREIQRLAHGDSFEVGSASVEVRHTPGHTPGSICLVVGGAVLTGDTLFPGGPGHSRSNELLLQEIASITSQLHTLPEDSAVLPGHGDNTTIGASRQEYAVFASKEHPADLHGDVLWLES